MPDHTPSPAGAGREFMEQTKYRDLHLDTGHVCQNLYLAAETIGCGVCAIATFDDDATAKILGIDGIHQFLIYLATVGKRKQGGDWIE